MQRYTLSRLLYHEQNEKAEASSLIGAGDRTRTGTLSPAVDFESTTSTIPSHRQVCYFIVAAFSGRMSPAFAVPGVLLGLRLRRSPTAAPTAPSLDSATGGARVRAGGF